MLELKNISDKNDISLDLVCYLQSSDITKDKVGNQISTPIDRFVYCAELPISSAEFYNAGQKGIKSEHLLVIDLEEYDNELTVKYNNIVYSIYRTYPRSDGLIELYYNKKAGG